MFSLIALLIEHRRQAALAAAQLPVEARNVAIAEPQAEELRLAA